MVRATRPLIIALTTLVATAALLGVTAVSPALAATHTCPKLTRAQIGHALGFRVVQIETHAAGGEVDCLYALPKNASAEVHVYPGAGELAKLKAYADENLGTLDSQGDQSGSPCTPSWGPCSGTQYAAGESPLQGLGTQAIAFPGAEGAGAFVIYVYRNETFNVSSSGPYALPREPGGPNEAELLAFARLLLRIHFSLTR